ncbi:stalk domain-containing protein [Paenibacillus sp. NPDC056579]|uniref:stalk domain-containing protein n=1 Tax=Paenibacillus sp. NPDC056579 TaxID=3345871 RepID=UPI003696278D
MTTKRFSRSLKIIVCAFLLLTLIPQALFSAEKTINIYFNGELLYFDNAQPVLKDGRTLVPFRKLFETLGFAVKWVDTGSLRQAIGTKDGLEIELTINDNNAKVNGKSILLDVPAQMIQDSTMVPLRFVSENSGYQVTFTDSSSASEIQIRSAGAADEAPAPAPNTDDVEPYVVKGRVVDTQGRPIQGAEVFADNQLLYNSNLNAVTDANGYYRIDLPLLATTWRMGGSHSVNSYKIDLTPEVDAAFAGNTGAIRNFTLQAETVYGELYLYIALDDFVKGYMENNVELTLTPIDSSMGGSGQVITKYGYNFPGGFGMNDVPLGKYKVTARYAPPGEKPLQMLVSVRNKGKYADSVEFEFSPLVPGIYQAEIEVKMP